MRPLFEQFEPATGEPLGDRSQAIVHASFVGAVYDRKNAFAAGASVEGGESRPG